MDLNWKQDQQCINDDDGFFAVCDSEETAEFAVKAINNHDTIVQLLKDVWNFPFVKQGEEEYRLHLLLEEIKEALEAMEVSNG